MVERTFTMASSFETRSAALFVQTASKFRSKVLLQVDDRIANAKSIMGIISLGINDGQKIQLIVEGDDERHVIPALEQFFIGVY